MDISPTSTKLVLQLSKVQPVALMSFWADVQDLQL